MVALDIYNVLYEQGLGSFFWFWNCFVNVNRLKLLHTSVMNAIPDRYIVFDCGPLCGDKTPQKRAFDVTKKP